jgi:ABC-type branched-subunit amino acid transport system substrate-binding protein
MKRAVFRKRMMNQGVKSCKQKVTFGYSWKSLSLLFCSLLLLLLASCGGRANPYLSRARDIEKGGGRIHAPGPHSTVTRRPHIPWLLWFPSQDFEGRSIKIPDIKKGDALVSEGRYSEALTTFISINPSSLSGRERRALAFRTAATQLTLNQSDAALGSLSEYFTSVGLRVKDVGPEASLFLGYAYGQADNAEQSMAWFVRAHRLATDNRRIRELVKEAVERTLTNIPPEQFEHQVTKWRRETFVDQIVAEERARRAARGYHYASRDLFRVNPFSAHHSTQRSTPSRDGSKQIVAILPLTGRYASLGENVKRGIQLAFKSEGLGDSVSVHFIDSAGSEQTAIVELEQYLGTGAQPLFVIGPLLSDPAQAVGERLRRIGIPMLSFSKRNTFRTGGGIFRLGITAEGQVERLIEKAHLKLKVRSYAIVASNDYTGYEYADSFREQLALNRLQLEFEGTYDPANSASIQSMAEQLERKKVDGVFFSGSLEDAALFFSSMPLRYRQGVRPLGTAAWDNSTKLRNSQRALDGALFISPFNEKSERSLVINFIDAYKKTFGVAPDFLAAQGFDAATLVSAAVKQGMSQGYSFAQALVDVGEYEGLTGLLTITTDGEIRRKYATILFEKGTLQELPLRTLIQVGN